jgi:hypothetical protein
MIIESSYAYAEGTNELVITLKVKESLFLKKVEDVQESARIITEELHKTITDNMTGN